MTSINIVSILSLLCIAKKQEFVSPFFFREDDDYSVYGRTTPHSFTRASPYQCIDLTDSTGKSTAGRKGRALASPVQKLGGAAEEGERSGYYRHSVGKDSSHNISSFSAGDSFRGQMLVLDESSEEEEKEQSRYAGIHKVPSFSEGNFFWNKVQACSIRWVQVYTKLYRSLNGSLCGSLSVYFNGYL